MNIHFKEYSGSNLHGIVTIVSTIIGTGIGVMNAGKNPEDIIIGIVGGYVGGLFVGLSSPIIIPMGVTAFPFICYRLIKERMHIPLPLGNNCTL